MPLQVLERRAYAWEALPDFAGPPRDGARVVHFVGRTLMFGGWNTVPTANGWWPGVHAGAYGYTTNEAFVWNEVTGAWALVKEHDPDATDRPGPRHTAPYVVVRIAGVDWLYCLGGDVQNGGTPDVWRTRDPLEEWELVTASAPWGSRFLHMAGALNGVLYVMGGQSDIDDKSTAKRDVWASSDGGVTWTRLADAPWAPRGMVYDPVEYRGELWLVAGGTYGGTRDYFNDVWRFDGATWTEVLPNGHAQFTGRAYHNVVVFGGRLWLSAGWRNANLNDVYSTTDGKRWQEQPDTPWAVEHAAGLAATPRGLLHVTGNALDLKVHVLRQAA